jgi:tRNA/rRNA methyltransferase
MAVASLVLVETSMPGNLGAAMRVAANFGVRRLDLVRPMVDPGDAEVLRWACGADAHLEVREWDEFEQAVAGYRTLAATASARGRYNLPVMTPAEGAEHLRHRGLDDAALVFGNETSGLRREDLDRADLVIRVPTSPAFPVLNVTQTVAILLGFFSFEVEPPRPSAPKPAPTVTIEGLMDHLGAALGDIGFADPGNPDRILRKLRRLFGRAGITENEVKIIRGVCRQMQWAAKTDPEIVANARPDRSDPTSDCAARTPRVRRHRNVVAMDFNASRSLRLCGETPTAG